MLTFQDLQEAKGNGGDVLTEFLRRSVQEHFSSAEAQEAMISRQYYDGENPTIAGHKHWIADEFGEKMEDIWTPNHKEKTQFLSMAVDQRFSFLLANGVSFQKDETKGRLETPDHLFDSEISLATMEAYIGGASWTFWNHDHMEVFERESFKPYPDEDDGAVKSGIRIWRLNADHPMLIYLFEMDGYSIYKENRQSRELELYKPFRAYRLRSVRSQVAEQIYNGEPYPSFPIVPLYANRRGLPLIHGKRATIDALDTCRSTQVNNADQNLLYFLFEGFEGMTDFDIVSALARLRQLHGLATPPIGASSNASIAVHSTEPPFEGINTTIAEIKEALNFDFRIFNPQSIIASSDTATAIKAAYELLNVETNKFEIFQLQPYVAKILQLAGIQNEKPVFRRDEVTNVYERMQTLMLAAQYLPQDYVVKAILTLLGDIDSIPDVLRQLTEEDAARIRAEEKEQPSGGNAEKNEEAEEQDEPAENGNHA